MKPNLEFLFQDLLLTNTPATSASDTNCTIFQFALNKKKKVKGKKGASSSLLVQVKFLKLTYNLLIIFRAPRVLSSKYQPFSFYISDLPIKLLYSCE